jgi:hypothetical protein
MSKIVELKIGEIENVVGGVNAALSVNTANARPVATQGNTANAQIPRPQTPKPANGLLLERLI